MQCVRCNHKIPEGEQRELHGQILCEDCYIDQLSPLKACDPWAVFSARTLMKNQEIELTVSQKRILTILEKNGPTEPEQLSGILGLTPKDLERELASLRHMEKVRGELREGKRIIRLF